MDTSCGHRGLDPAAWGFALVRRPGRLLGFLPRLPRPVIYVSQLVSFGSSTCPHLFSRSDPDEPFTTKDGVVLGVKGTGADGRHPVHVNV